MNPQFTTQTFPNHWSIVTGAYQETHGIVSNTFYDPVYGEQFKRENGNELKWWNATEPIWWSLVRQNKRAGTYYWPGADVYFIPNATDSQYRRMEFDKTRSFEKKVDDVVDWFVRENFVFVALYHNEPDAAGHKYGIDSAEFNKTIQRVDQGFGYLIDKLHKSSLLNSSTFNLLVVSDHGMVNIKKHVFLDEFFEEGVDGEIWSESSSLIHIKPLIDREELLAKLDHIPNVTVVPKDRLPRNLYYTHNRRIGEVLLIADEGVAMIYSKNKPKLRDGSLAPVEFEERKKSFVKDWEKATHGYSKNLNSMKGVFMARGSAFKRGFFERGPIENVDIYTLMCHIMWIRCEQTNGSFIDVKVFLSKNTCSSFGLDVTSLLLAVISLLIFNR